MNKKKGKKLRKIKISREKMFLSAGIVLASILLGIIVFTIVFLNNSILPILPSNGSDNAGGVHFDFEGYERLEL